MKKIVLLTFLSLVFCVAFVSVVEVNAAETEDYMPTSFTYSIDVESEYLYRDDVWFPIIYQDYDCETNEKAYFPNNNFEYVFKYDFLGTEVNGAFNEWHSSIYDMNPYYVTSLQWVFGVENDPDFSIDDVSWLSSNLDEDFTGIVNDSNELVLSVNLNSDISFTYFPVSSGIDILYEGDGDIYFSECYFFINATPTEYSEDVYYDNVGIEYNNLPDSEEIFLDIFDWTVSDPITNTYELILKTEEHPDTILNSNYDTFYWYFKVALDPELDYSALNKRQIKYVTNEIGDRILIFDLESDQLGNQIYSVNDIDTPVKLYRSTYTINLTKEEVYKYEDFSVNAVVKKDSNSVAYLNMYLPMMVEELISLSLHISYRIDELFIINDPIIEEEMYYESGTTTEINPPSWTFWLTAGFLYNSLDANDVYNLDTITKVEFFDDETNDYALNLLGLSEDAVTNANKYQICLGQYGSLTSVGYDISNVALINMIYESEGIYYEVSEDLLNTNTSIVIDETGDSWIDKIQDGIDSIFNEDDSEVDEMSFFEQIRSTSTLLISGICIILTFVIVIKIVDSKKRR